MVCLHVLLLNQPFTYVSNTLVRRSCPSTFRYLVSRIIVGSSVAAVKLAVMTMYNQNCVTITKCVPLSPSSLFCFNWIRLELKTVYQCSGIVSSISSVQHRMGVSHCDQRSGKVHGRNNCQHFENSGVFSPSLGNICKDSIVAKLEDFGQLCNRCKQAR
jgi:hypothetical protein